MDNQAWVQLACGALIVIAIALACAWRSEKKEKAYFERLSADLSGQLEKQADAEARLEKALDNIATRAGRVRDFVRGRHVTVMNKKTGRFGPFEVKDLDAVMDGKEIA